MRQTQAIYIQGCARSGNTLMRELCVSGFRGAELLKMTNDVTECSLSHLVETLYPGRKHTLLTRTVRWFSALKKKPQSLLVASRDHDVSLSMDMKLLLKNPEVKVLWMLRNPLDVLTSMHPRLPGEFYVKPERLLKSLQLYDRFKNKPQVLTVHYEELVSDPNVVQAKISQAFHLEPLRDFTEGHKYFPRDVNLSALHSVRPVDANSVQKWKTKPGYKEHLQKVLAEYPMIASLARDYGYEINLA